MNNAINLSFSHEGADFQLFTDEAGLLFSWDKVTGEWRTFETSNEDARWRTVKGPITEALDRGRRA